MHDTMNENATTLVRLHATYTVATPRWARISPVDCSSTKSGNGYPIGSRPKNERADHQADDHDENDREPRAEHGDHELARTRGARG